MAANIGGCERPSFDEDGAFRRCFPTAVDSVNGTAIPVNGSDGTMGQTFAYRSPRHNGSGLHPEVRHSRSEYVLVETKGDFRNGSAGT